MPVEPIEPPDFDKPDPEPANALGTGAVNAAEPEGVRAQVKAQAQRARSSAEFWSSVFSTPEGRREMWGILADLRTFEITGGVSANGGYDPIISAHHASRRDVGQKLFLAWMAYDREGVLQMLFEHQPRVIEVARTVTAVRPRGPRKKNPTA
jgi:hypothetical protein